MNYYTDERNAQIVISLLKAHNIKKVIASPGTTNICLVASMMNDEWFEMYSAPDERSAGYIACGMAAESGEPVVISCTGATASRNYMPALTEAFYRKLPVVAITSSRRSYRIGHNYDQVTDRSQLPKDVARISVQVPLVYDEESEWADIIAVNKALLELNHHGGGPVHINLETNYSLNYQVKELPGARAIYRIMNADNPPQIDKDKKIAVYIGNHRRWSERLTEALERFCETNNAIVICDNISNYKGKYGIRANLSAQQAVYKAKVSNVDLMVHIGDISTFDYQMDIKEVWRVNPDGEIRDPFRKLTYVFEMDELDFFNIYNHGEKSRLDFYEICKKEYDFIKEKLDLTIIKLPFSNAWVASQIADRLPKNSIIHFGIQNSLRFWNYFELDHSILAYCNTGGFGIDGSISSAIGAALSAPDKLCFCVLGDLAFFYDINSLGNRHVPNNLRVLLINNGKGTEFKLEGNPGYLFGKEADQYIAAAGHYGNMSHMLVKHYAEDLGFEYFSAATKEELTGQIELFVDSIVGSKPMIFEIFTDSSDENLSLNLIRSLEIDEKLMAKRQMKKVIKGIIGEKAVHTLKQIRKMN